MASPTALVGGPCFLFVQRLVVGLWLSHGERPDGVRLVAIVVPAVTLLLYGEAGTFVLDPDTVPSAVGRPTWRNALYYSLASFASLGYGGWVPTLLGWARWVGAVEAFFGIIWAVALSISLTQRITR